MNEIVVRVLRALACLARLRMLCCMARTDEITPTDLARELRMRLDLVCTHLRRLTSAGLIERRRSGVWCYCRARSPYPDEAFSAKITSWVCRLLRSPRQVRVARDHHSLGPDAQAELQRTIFEAATAFTNVRRLRILRRLAGGEAVTIRTLTGELRLSEAAAGRHLAKLVRRGYVDPVRAGRYLTYRLARRFKTPVHGRLFEIVCGEWARKELQS